jgi:hypothetical protein
VNGSAIDLGAYEHGPIPAGASDAGAGIGDDDALPGSGGTNKRGGCCDSGDDGRGTFAPAAIAALALFGIGRAGRRHAKRDTMSA